MKIRIKIALAAAVTLAAPRIAFAGGFELPDNGAEAIGRGGAFTAKADSPLALEYNVAGLARQRGTRLLVDANLNLYNISFTRAGVYPGDPNDAAVLQAMPYAGQKYPTMNDSLGAFPVPFLGLTTDFNYFKKWTFGLAIIAPHAGGAHNYGVADPSKSEVATTKLTLANGQMIDAPAPSRYDITRTNLLVIFPTLGVGYSPTKYLDIGVAAQLVYASFKLANANVTDLGKNPCKGAEDTPYCDAYGAIDASGLSWGAIFSLLAHPTPYLDIGATYRPQIDVHAGVGDEWMGGDPHGNGTLTASVPPLLPKVAPGPVSFNAMFPHQLRLAIRYVSRYRDNTERFDVEVDGIYENWSSRNNRWGQPFNTDHYTHPERYRVDTIHSPDFIAGPSGELNINLNHNFMDTYGLRVGGAYNHRLSDISRLIIRGGFYFDSAATDYAHTRLDFNTAAKYALTAGLGYKFKGFTINIAYAFVYSPSRTVTNSATQPVSSLNGTDYRVDDNGNPKDPVYNPGIGNGKYEYSNHIISLGLTFNIPEFKSATKTGALYAN